MEVSGEEHLGKGCVREIRGGLAGPVCSQSCWSKSRYLMCRVGAPAGSGPAQVRCQRKPRPLPSLSTGQLCCFKWDIHSSPSRPLCTESQADLHANLVHKIPKHAISSRPGEFGLHRFKYDCIRTHSFLTVKRQDRDLSAQWEPRPVQTPGPEHSFQNQTIPPKSAFFSALPFS